MVREWSLDMQWMYGFGANWFLSLQPIGRRRSGDIHRETCLEQCLSDAPAVTDAAAVKDASVVTDDYLDQSQRSLRGADRGPGGKHSR